MKDIWNLIDWCSMSLLLTYFILLFDKTDSDENKVVGAIGLMIMYYRSFSYLRVFDPFTTLIGMINEIIGKLIIFFIILFYFYFTTVLLMMKLDPEQSRLSVVSLVYLWTFFGGVDGSDFEDYKLSYIAIYFGTIIVTIILLNILIAFLSNLFSGLEDQQKANDLKEKASMILDLEAFVYFFKYKLTGRAGQLFQIEKYSINLFDLNLREDSRNLEAKELKVSNSNKNE